jgi:hypothetical protein
LVGLLAAPAGEKIDVAEFAADGVDRARRSDADAGEFGPSLVCAFAQHAGDEFDALVVVVGIGGRLHAGEHFAGVIDNADRDFRAADVDGADHEYSGVIARASSSVIRFLFL